MARTPDLDFESANFESLKEIVTIAPAGRILGQTSLWVEVRDMFPT